MVIEKGSSTKQQILNMLKTKGPMTVNEMANQLKITEMAVRRHLNTLERDDLIESKLVRQAMGRPTNMYSLTEQADMMFPKNYHDLALDILHEIKNLEGDNKIDLLFQNREKRLEEMYKERMEGLNFEEKVSQLALIQNSKGYMVEFDQIHPGEYVFKEHNCPIAHVAREFIQACIYELSLFRKVLEADVIQKQCMARGAGHCIYVIKEKQD